MFDKLDADSPALPSKETSAKIEPVLETTLMSHQLEGLAWMVQREKNPDPTGERNIQVEDEVQVQVQVESGMEVNRGAS